MKSNKKTKYNENVLNWDELNSIGVNRESLEKTENLFLLLSGEETSPLLVKLPIFNEIQEVEATLRLIEDKGKILLQITNQQSEPVMQD